MNAAQRFDDDLAGLENHVRAANDNHATEAQADAAQRRLMRRLAQAGEKPGTVTGAPRWRLAAAAAALAVLAVTVVPFIPGGRDGVAFADVQRWFESFRTLRVAMTMTANDRQVMAMDILVDEAGRTRLDSGDMFTYVIDPRAGVMLQLFHQARMARTVDLGTEGSVPADVPLDWLADIRDFQGDARELPGTRTLNGRQVQGFELVAGGQHMVLWATAEGEPVRLLITAGGDRNAGTETRLDFEFDEPLPASSFDATVPDGYSTMPGEGETG